MGKIRQNARQIAAALLGAWVALILWLTIFRRGEVVTDVPFSPPFRSLMQFWSDIRQKGIRGNFLGNILVFIPVGFLHPVAFVAGNMKKRGRFLFAILFGTGLSLLIEITQLLTARGYFDYDDILLNAAGCAAGYGIFRTVGAVFRRNATATKENTK